MQWTFKPKAVSENRYTTEKNIPINPMNQTNKSDVNQTNIFKPQLKKKPSKGLKASDLDSLRSDYKEKEKFNEDLASQI
jgi:hypothetical protein